MALLEKETEEREETEKQTEKETEKQREKEKEEERAKEREEEEEREKEREKGDEECRCKSYLCWPFSRVRCRKRRAHNSSPSNHTSGAPLKEPSSCKEESCKVVPAEQAVEVGGTGIHSIPKAEQDLILSSRLRRFSFGELKAATRNFRPDSLLGEGGFGCVFKGWVDEHGTAAVKPGTGLTVAVKTLNHNGLQGHREWLTEVNFLGQLHHPNLVKLIGCCIEDDHRLLVYEFMQRGSLENHLFRRALPLPWNTRMKIALGAAKGLEFLHSGEKPVIYRDFKTSNILLDSEYNAKLSDFGLAKDGPERDKSHVSTRVMGTYGYAAPEYIMTGHLSVKSDVYSFGVVLLEILTGRKCMDKSRPSREHNLVEWARPYLGDKRKLFKLVDPRLEGQFSIKAAQKAAGLGHRCIGRDSKSRPLMSEVVDILISIQGLTDMANTSTHFPPLATDRYLRASMNPYNKLHLGPRNNNYNMAYQYRKPNHP